MAVTTASVLTNTVKALYDADYILQVEKSECWSQFAWWKKGIGGANLKGSSYNFPIFNRLELATTALTESSDVTPVAMADQNVQVTFAEYGNAVQTTEMLNVQNYVEIGKPAAEVIAQNMVETRDKLIRNAAVGGTWVWRPGGNTVRTGLDTTNDKITLAALHQIVALARNANIPTVGGKNPKVAGRGGKLFTMIHPLLLVDMLADTTINAIVQYSKPELALNGEIGELAGLTVLSHEYGKLYLSGGTTAQAATTLNGGVAAGDTTVIVTSATGITVGDYITIGTLEAVDAEQVKVTAVDTNTLTIEGIGNADGNFGLKYAHLTGAAVTEAANVAAVPVFGPLSLPAVWASEIGQNGRADQEFAATVIPKRFINHSWYGIWGFGKIQKRLIRGEFACSVNLLGPN